MTRAIRFKHSLIVGGTGMLAEAAEWVLERSDAAHVVGRNARRIEDLTCARPLTIEAVRLDVRQTDDFAAALDVLCDVHGDFDFALVWLHADAQDAWIPIAKRVGSVGMPGRIVAVLGSASRQPAPHEGTDRLDQLVDASRVSLQRVVLGFVPGQRGEPSRWLTHEEISRGVIAAIESAAPRSVVGVLEPWSDRP